VELQARHPRRADGCARRRPDGAGARARRLADQGLAVVLISHNLHDIFETATRITVLRLGRNVGIYERAATTQQEVVQAITAGIPTKVAGITSTDPVVA
jgi:ABC-type sugar transport system ATPase subunit